MSKKILSIYASHDASATFVDKNDQLRILELERFCNIRFAMFSSQFDDLTFARHLATNRKVRREFISYIKSQIKDDPDVIICNQLNHNDLLLVQEYFPNSEFEDFDGHHISHAYGSYFQSPFRDALIFTVDGGGSDLGMHTTTKVFNAVETDITEIYKSELDYGTAYSFIGEPISEISPNGNSSELGVFLTYAGKIMGLCAYGKVVPEWIEPLTTYYKTHRDLKKLSDDIGIPLTVNCLAGELSYNLAATSQKVFEDLLFPFIMDYFEKYQKNIVLTGGCALNVLFNQKLKTVLNERGFDLYVPPNPNDCGQSVGQYLYETKTFVQPLVYSGFDILDREDLPKYLESGKYKTEEVHASKIVQLISEGKIGGIIQGYSEIGPRALGNRSIICDPSFKDMKDVLNAKVKFREWFRPFAPVCREEDMHTYFDDAFPSHYMSYAPMVKLEYRDMLPSITHIDGTSRLQTVTKEQHTLFYNILSCMSEQNKIPVILNTSFNIKGRPILTRLEDAFHVLDNTELDFLVIEDILVLK